MKLVYQRYLDADALRLSLNRDLTS